MANIPIIDLKKAEDSNQIEQLSSACEDHGFFFLKNHGMEKEITEMWKESKAFFNLSRKEKLKIIRTDENPLGFYDRELTKRKRDLKEVFDYMRPRKDSKDYNQWPSSQKFQQTMLNFFEKASDVADITLGLVFRSIKTSFSVFPSGDKKTSTVRLNYYPVDDPLNLEEKDNTLSLGDMALHHHTDPGILTLLLQDMSGGLQTYSKESGWIDIPPEKDTIVVNLGDAMQVWTNDKYVAALHRVTTRVFSERYSTPYFFNPSNDAVIQPLQALSKSHPKFSSFTWKEYIQGRVNDNYSDIGEEDIQIDRFRLT